MNKNRALLLDRDGIINRDTDHVGSVERFEFLPGLFSFLRGVRDRGYRLAVITNQSGVARQKFSRKDYEKIAKHMRCALYRESIDLELTLACFEHPEGTLPELARESYWRKPNPGMVLEAIRRLDLDPARSAFLGDKMRDMEAAQSGGIGYSFLLNEEMDKVPAGIIRVKNYQDVEKLLPL